VALYYLYLGRTLLLIYNLPPEALNALLFVVIDDYYGFDLYDAHFTKLAYYISKSLFLSFE